MSSSQNVKKGTGSGENLTYGQRQRDDPLPSSVNYYYSRFRSFYEDDISSSFLRSGPRYTVKNIHQTSMWTVLAGQNQTSWGIGKFRPPQAVQRPGLFPRCVPTRHIDSVQSTPGMSGGTSAITPYTPVY
jgi:hypothetical protein